MPRGKSILPTKNTKSPSTSGSHPIHHSVEVKQPGFFSNVFQGFGLGAGQSLAFNMFRSDPVVKHVHVDSKEYKQCMEDRQDEDYCKQYKQ